MTILKQLRLSNRYTQKQFAKILGVNINTYIAYENGKREIPPKLLAKILKMRGKESDCKLAEMLEKIYE